MKSCENPGQPVELTKRTNINGDKDLIYYKLKHQTIRETISNPINSFEASIGKKRVEYETRLKAVTFQQDDHPWSQIKVNMDFFVHI